MKLLGSSLLAALALVQSAFGQSSKDDDVKTVPLRTHSLYQVCPSGCTGEKEEQQKTYMGKCDSRIWTRNCRAGGLIGAEIPLFGQTS